MVPRFCRTAEPLDAAVGPGGTLGPRLLRRDPKVAPAQVGPIVLARAGLADFGGPVSLFQSSARGRFSLTYYANLGDKKIGQAYRTRQGWPC